MDVAVARGDWFLDRTFRCRSARRPRDPAEKKFRDATDNLELLLVKSYITNSVLFGVAFQVGHFFWDYLDVELPLRRLHTDLCLSTTFIQLP